MRVADVPAEPVRPPGARAGTASGPWAPAVLSERSLPNADSTKLTAASTCQPTPKRRSASRYQARSDAAAAGGPVRNERSGRRGRRRQPDERRARRERLGCLSSESARCSRAHDRPREPRLRGQVDEDALLVERLQLDVGGDRPAPRQASTPACSASVCSVRARASGGGLARNRRVRRRRREDCGNEERGHHGREASRAAEGLDRPACSSCRGGPSPPPARPRPAARSARAYASETVSPPAITSPVERISGPRFAADREPLAREDGLLGECAPRLHPLGQAEAPERLARAGAGTRDRRAGARVAFDTNGTVREARGLASSTNRRPSWSASWRLRRPRAPRPRANDEASPRISASSSAVTDGAGSTHAESPEWTPAGSTCSRIAATQAPLPSQSASTSSSRAPSRNASTSAGSFSSRSSGPRGDPHSPAAEDVVRPDEHRVAELPGDGVARPPWSPPPPTPARSARALRAASRNARGPPPARSQGSGSPSSGTPAAASDGARRSGVWPPSETTTPSGSLQRAHVEHALDGERLEVEPVRRVVVGRDGLGVRVHEDDLVPEPAERRARPASSSSRTRSPGRCGSAPSRGRRRRPRAPARRLPARTRGRSTASSPRTRPRTSRPPAGPVAVAARRTSSSVDPEHARDGRVGEAEALRSRDVAGRRRARAPPPRSTAARRRSTRESPAGRDRASPPRAAGPSARARARRAARGRAAGRAALPPLQGFQERLGKVRPSPSASPTARISLPSVVSAPGNFSKSNRGALTAT